MQYYAFAVDIDRDGDRDSVFRLSLSFIICDTTDVQCICNITHLQYDSSTLEEAIPYALIHLDDCNTLPHTAPHCNTLQYTHAPHCTTLQRHIQQDTRGSVPACSHSPSLQCPLIFRILSYLLLGVPFTSKRTSHFCSVRLDTGGWEREWGGDGAEMGSVRVVGTCICLCVSVSLCLCVGKGRGWGRDGWCTGSG